MKKRILAMLLCVCTLLSFTSIASAETKTASFYEGTNGFFYPFNEADQWTKSKLSLANQSMSSYLESDGINNSGMLEMKNTAGSGAISAGVSAITMEAGKNLNIRGKVRYANYENLVKNQMYIALFVTGLAGAPLYSDPECTVKTGDATGGYVQMNVSTDVNGASMGDGAWHEFEATFSVKGAKHSTGNYVDLTGKTVNIWFRPYAGNAFTATTKYFTQAYLDACSENEITPYADVLLDDFEGYMGNKAEKKTYVQDANTVYLDFNGADAHDTTHFLARHPYGAYEETLGGKNGVITVKNNADTLVTPTYSVQAKANSKLRVSGDAYLVNADKLNSDNVSVTAVLIYSGGPNNNPAGFYEDEACTIPFETVNANAIGQSASMLTGIGNGGWEHFSYDFDTAKVYKTSIKKTSSDSAKTIAYVKPWEVAQISVWLRVTGDGAMASSVTASEKNFTAAYLTECGYTKGTDGKWTAGASATKPYIMYGLDNYSIESVPADSPSANTPHGTTAYHKTATSLYYNFNGPSTADTTAFISKQAPRAHAESFAGKNGVVTLKDEATSVDTVYFDIKGEAGKKLKVAGDIAVMNNADVKEQNLNVNALLIMNGGPNNNPAGFYEDEACTIPVASVNANAICHQVTMQKGIAQEGWTHYEYLFDTDVVFKSSIKRNASDSAKTTVYIKPWEVEKIQVWMRISSGVAGNTTHTISENLFTADYLTACGYTKGDDGKWTAGASATNPFIQTAWDNLAIQNVSDEKTFEDFKVENITFSKTGKINIGDEITANFTVPEGFTAGKARVYLLADGETIGYALAENGTFTVTAARELYGKTLSVKVIPSDANGTYSETATTAEIGTVGGALVGLSAESNGLDTVTWRYDVVGDVEASQVVVALYDTNNRLLSVSATPVEAQTNVDGVVASGTASHAKVQTAKVTVWNSLNSMSPLTEAKVVTFPPVNDDPFAGDDEINVVFLGGSITYGEAAVDKADAYAGLTADWLKETYGEDKVNYYNAGKSGTPSNYGIMRLDRDVLAYEPDLVFVEFAVNDSRDEESTRAMESIVRTLASSAYNPYIVFLYTTNNNYTTNPTNHQIIADFYGIPEISLKDALYEALDGKDPKAEGYFKDSVHPTEQGHAIYAEAIIDALSTGRYYKKPVVTDKKYKAKSGVITAEHIDLTGDTVFRTPDWDVSTEGANPNISTIWEGESVTFTFSGNALAVEHALNEAGAQYEVYVDGELVGKGDTYYKGVTWDQLALGFNTFDLADGEHEVEIRTVASDNTNATGTQVKLYGVFVGRYVD